MGLLIYESICKGLNENRSLVSLKLSQNEIGEKGIIQGLKYIILVKIDS